MKRLSLRAVPAVLMLVLLACGSGGSGGAMGGCPAGTEGCACVQNKCGMGDNGTSLLCMNNTCQTMHCPAGSTGCVCGSNGACNTGGDTCTNGLCVTASNACTAGALNCQCLAGGCTLGLHCLQDTVCVDATGYEGGACMADSTCNHGNRCDTASGVCVHCDLGTAGCACNPGNTCNAGLACNNSVCRSAAQLPPMDPKCYSPCNGDVIVDAGHITCGPDHLIDGCLPGQTCTQGSCLAPGMTKPTCSQDLDCPFFQVCLAGGCYSNCDVNADCESGSACSAHVCRTVCTTTTTTSTSPCASGLTCSATDGTNGYCIPVGHSTGATNNLPTGSVSASVALINVSNVQTGGAFTLLPSGSNPQDVTIRKKWHETRDSMGVVTRVDAPLDSSGAYRDCDPVKGECVLPWLALQGPGGTPTQDPTLVVRVLPGCVDPAAYPDAGPGDITACPQVQLTHAADTTAISYEAELEVSTAQSSTTVHLSYVQRPDGQWTGSMYYFGTFSDQGLQQWVDSSNKTDASMVKNALIQRWAALRAGTGMINGWDEFLAVLTSTREGSWQYSNVQTKCAATGNPVGAVCYPYTNSSGVRQYVVSSADAPVPTGVSELPLAMNLQLDSSMPGAFAGTIVTAVAMHYPGNPGVRIQFGADPALPTSCASGTASDCLVYLKYYSSADSASMNVNQVVSTIGGRYAKPHGVDCGMGYGAIEIPWLVPGFTDGTELATTGNGLSKFECRDAELPFDVTTGQSNKAEDLSFAGGNPVPDGQPRTRTLHLIDGALVDQSQIFILFEESYSTFMQGRPPSKAYGYILLKRTPATLQASDFVGLKGPAATVKQPPVMSGATCDPTFANTFVPNAFSDDTHRIALVDALLNGTSTQSGFNQVLPSNPGIHYYCEDTGLFNGGPLDVGPSSAKIACPPGSKVTYFALCDSTGAGCSMTDAQVAADACMATANYQVDGEGFTCRAGSDCRSGICSGGMCVRGGCATTLSSWVSGNKIREGGTDAAPLLYQCSDTSKAYCDDDRQNLRNGKTFFLHNTSGVQLPTYLPLVTLVDDAFRYKTRFVSTVSGSTLGFSPQQCVPNSDAIPYCYDPAQIAEARMRTDCLLSLYTDDTFIKSTLPSFSSGTLSAELDGYLKKSFAEQDTLHSGFERLNAELLIMLGDDALTAAYGSRFDLAAAGGASFQGSLFETNGIDLTGVAGAEMFNLYLSVQYYQTALDRMYALGPDFTSALNRSAVGAAYDFVTPDMVTSYLQRLVRAASQKSVAYGEIARRYQNFNRPDLSRAVLERAYVATYLESALINRLMLDIYEQSAPQNLDQLRLTLTDTQRNYRLALFDMSDTYKGITDEVNYFGYAPDYIPFPALDSSDVTNTNNAYDVLLALAKQKTDLAAQREQIALTFGKQGKVDAAQFQSDLVSIRNNYENQLSSLCGTFTGDDGNVYPAIRKYAALATTPTLLGDPCGHMGNGDIFTAMGDSSAAILKLQEAALHHQNILQNINSERRLAAQLCQIDMDLANYVYNNQGVVADMQQDIDDQKAIVGFAVGACQAAQAALQAVAGSDTGATGAAVAGGITAIGVAAAGTELASNLTIADQERKIAAFNADNVKQTTLSMCLSSTATADNAVAQFYGQSLEAELEVMEADYAMRTTIANVVKLANNAQRLQAQEDEAEQLVINIQAAANDPNVRIYQNDSVINADVTFNDALASAYRLTRVYEYYTSQSYQNKEQLFVIRMVTAGQYNLQNYLLELDNAYQAFTEEFGNPDLRVLSLSLKDDIMKIPLQGPNGMALSENDRIAMMRAKLKDPRSLDANGYLVIPFSTQLDVVSPLTRDHKIRHVEIDMQGVKMGDPVARVYIRMDGTGTVHTVTDDKEYYNFPSRLAVVNASLLGAKVYDPEVYRNYRFRDRPLVNTLWELIINQRDEVANQDIDLQTLTDIRVLFYYADFTAF